MDIKKQENPVKGVLIGHLELQKDDLLRAISWFDFVSEKEISEADNIAKENLIKVINYITRNS